MGALQLVRWEFATEGSATTCCHHIKRWIYSSGDPDQAILDALRGSGIELNIAITNHCLNNLASSQDYANNWVRDHVTNFPDVNFKYISVGNEVNPVDGDTSFYAQLVLPAMRNVYRAVCNAGLATRIKISTSIGMALLGNSYPPQDGAFRDDVMPYILTFLANTRSPLFVNIYPYFAYINNKAQIDLGYALLEPENGIEADGLYYGNIFYAMVDAVYAAVDRVVGPSVQMADRRKPPPGGYSGIPWHGGHGVTVSKRNRRTPPRGMNMSMSGWPSSGGDYNQTKKTLHRPTKIVVTESGWPSRGGDSANKQNSATYNQNLIEVVDHGTPGNSDPIETYIFGMYDENEKPGAATERNFGLNYPNGQPKYNIDFN